MGNSQKNQGLTSHTVRGEIARVVYANDEGTYSVLRVRDSNGQEHVVVGNISGAFEGQNLEATGKYETHREFGRQLRVEQFRFTLPSTREGIVKYLSSGMIEGIGPKYAECIVNHFGEKTLDILDNYSVRLQEVPGIGKKRAAMISGAWKEQSAKRDTFIFLQGLGISSLFCQKLYKEYGDRTAQVVKNNPYQLADEIDGIGFLMADRIASSLGISNDAAIRLAAGAIYTINQLTAAGHCCYPTEEFVQKCAETLQVDNEQAQCGITEALTQSLLVEDSGMYYPRNLFKAESELPGHLLRLISVKRHCGERLAKIPAASNILLSDEQLTAVERAGHSPVSIITGGPGVGKTTVVGEIVRKAKAAGLKIYLAAPTGRAAKRMSESTGFPAKTLHRMLKWEPAERSFAYNQYHPLPCDLLIVDEVSMLDLSLALCLFRAIKAGTTVILVGDKDQLPSVGPGDVFHCLLKSRLFLVTHLSKIFRQGEGSRIILNAHRVNNGQMPEGNSKQQELTDFYWIEQDDPERVADLILRMQSERIPQRFGFHPARDIQVLTPMNRGQVGTAALNQSLQEKLNPGHKPQFKSGDKVFKTGDKVMQTSNNYDKNVFNGDMGRIGNIDIKEKQFSVYFDNRAVTYEFTETDQLTLAYAITIHKSQGSEFPAVIMPMLNQHYMMLQRNLLYTGMTRARRLLILIGSSKAIGMAVRNSRLEPRYSKLLERLSNYRQEH
ncbi:ATP-dependent RecD-like DNA helicase [Lentisphaerota bacterium ZTH]|nr:ATP-dependent RecD-like DNA helicase [Lentisphaerota bacterium]WET07687.1 ATP-dependent RecD-like DNA helicase [Lentisphaerota bacterium ZTH]